ncbi:MAG TPA: L-histidine N(alpha)-methyltransferase [Longimicrobiaceae bacterium]|jgi:L-histidine N-alpha-methyltransferase|nr:L-histidine N(alpha)-methyltransferase [Longimicrobiaceae bacterium]
MAENACAEARAPAAMLAEIRDGLARPQKELSPKFFYDVRGSQLFEEITRLPEYYLTRTERGLLERWMPVWIAEMRPATLVELGAGSAVKTRIVLDAMVAAGSGEAYAPVDVSAGFLREMASGLRGEYPALSILPVVADMTERFDLPAGLAHPTLHALLGSTIGNFPDGEAVALLSEVRRRMGPADRFLMGVDLRKDPARIEAAYNDTAGVTAEFNLNMLRVLNHETGADFDVRAFRHRAFYEPVRHRIEMHLEASGPQTVHVPGVGPIRIAAGETIRTEVSCKHDRASIDAMFAGAGLRVERWETDDEGLYALMLGSPA